jgi:adenine-specific DNA-methyltransferase
MVVARTELSLGAVRLDEIKLANCLDLLRELPSDSVDLIVSSPPYNLGKEYESKRALEVYLDEQKAVLGECARVLKKTGSLFWQVGAFADAGMLIPLDIRFFPILENLGLIPRNRIVWVRQHGLHARNKFSCRHETILWFTKSDDYVFELDNIRVPQKYQNKKSHKGENHGRLSCNPDGKNPGDIWIFQNVKHNHEEQTIHPCQFPEDLITRILLATTNPGDVVFDPYMGAGTTAVVARDHGRHFIGAELDEDYFEVANRRLSGLPNEKGSFANLKTLRDHIEQTGEPIGKYRFDVQVGDQATTRDKAKRFSEEHHLQELEERLAYEEESFSAKLRNLPAPINKKYEKHKPKPTPPKLFEDSL